MLSQLNQVDIRLLRVFSRVVECGGFSAAQTELDLSQSTISSHMADLEARLGMRLCHRGRGGFRLTEDGHLVYEAAQQLFLALEAFTSQIEAKKGQLTGELHIGSVDNVMTNTDLPLAQSIDRFKRREPSVRLTLRIGTPAEIERGVSEGRFQVGLGGYTSRAPGVEYIRLSGEEQRLYCGRGHPLFGRGDRNIKDRELLRADYVARGYVPLSHLPLKGPPKIAAVAYNIEAIAIFIRSGRYIGFLPAHYAEPWVEKGEMRALRPADFHYTSRFELLLPRGRPYPAAARAFVDDLMVEFGIDGAGAEQRAPASARTDSTAAAASPRARPQAGTPSSSADASSSNRRP